MGSNSNKLLLWIALTIGVIVVAFFSCSKQNVAPTCSIAFLGEDTSIFVGDIIKLQTTSYDEDNNLTKAFLIINNLELPQQVSNAFTHEINSGIFKPGMLEIVYSVEDREGLCSSDTTYLSLNAIPSPLPEASFTSDVRSGIYPLSICFSDSSTNNPNIWYWNFGDGTISEEQNPCHTYDTSGIFSVTLATGVDVFTDTIVKQDYIEAIAPLEEPIAYFGTDTRTGKSPLTVQFRDSSTNNPSEWFWEFGDGATSTEQNPTHIYTEINHFFVALRASNEAGTDRKVRYHFIVVSDSIQPPVAKIEYPRGAHIDSTVQFTDVSEHEPDFWLWEFGDGSYSDIQNPTHTYSATGEYTVQLVVRNSLGYDTVLVENAVHVFGPCDDTPTVTDIDGNTYHTVQIGNQCWMAENLNTTHYPDGTSIPYITGFQEWADLLDVEIDDAYCYMENQYTPHYGALYTYAAAIAWDWVHDNEEGQGICPDGWHLPTDNEWMVLEGYADSQYPIGGLVWEETGERGYDVSTNLRSTSGWRHQENGLDRFGFNAEAAGRRDDYNGEFFTGNYEAVFWSSTKDYTLVDRAYQHTFWMMNGKSIRDRWYMSEGASVRCLKN